MADEQTIPCACGLADAIFQGQDTVNDQIVDVYECPQCGFYYVAPDYQPDSRDINTQAQELLEQGSAASRSPSFDFDL